MLKNIKIQELNSLRPAIFFLVKAVGIFILWVIINSFFPDFIYSIHYVLIRIQTYLSYMLLSGIGFQTSYIFGDGICLGRLVIEGINSVCVGTGCSGFELFLIFSVFILLIGSRSTKTISIFLLLGLVLIFFLNVIRISALSLIYRYEPTYLEFNHKYTFVLVVYAAIFGLWFIWTKRYAD